MGDRATICVKGNGSEVYLYTHWGGYRIKEIVANALSKRERWSDTTYLTRIIFDSMTELEGGTEGYGISSVPCEGLAITVNTDDKTVITEFKDISSQPAGARTPWYSFDEFIEEFFVNPSRMFFWSNNIFRI
jgi:hypothetical protein